MPRVGENWTCPYCAHAQVISDDRHAESLAKVWVEGWIIGKPCLYYEAIVCANTKCKQMTLTAEVSPYKDTGNGAFQRVTPVLDWKLLPKSTGKVFPEFIPKPLRDDYEEACAIRDLSPKASATIIRRCIQGMIRDFCGIQGSRLIDEIKELKRRVDEGDAPKGVEADTVAAIDHVRGIGNIGAHMEKDIGVIVDVDPDEAQMLIELTELLFAEWYIARERRKERLIAIGAMAKDKAAARTEGKKKEG